MLVKLTPVVNLINILQAAFAPIFLRQKTKKKKQSQILSRDKLCKTLLYKKAGCKMLVKLTPGGARIRRRSPGSCPDLWSKSPRRTLKSRMKAI